MIHGSDYNERVKYILATGLLTACMLAGVMYYSENLMAFGASLVRLGKSLVLYFANFFGVKIEIAGGSESAIPPVIVPVLPETYDLFSVKIAAWGNLLFSGENAAEWGAVGGSLVFIASIAVSLFPLFLLIRFCFKKFGKKTNNNYGAVTKPLSAFLKVERIFSKLKNKCLIFWNYLLSPIFFVTLLFLFLLFSGVITLLLSVLGYALYFSATLKIDSVWNGISGVASDAALMFRSMPVFVWIVFAILIARKIVINSANKKLIRRWAVDLNYAEDLGVCTLVCGLMRTGKSTLLTTLGLAMQTVFRSKANEKIKKIMLRYPRFPWAVLNEDLKEAMYYHDVYSLTSAKDYILERKKEFEKTPSSALVWGYDFDRYPFTYDDKLRETDLWETLKTYAKLFFIYASDTSLLVSNYAVRDDSFLIDSGNYPLWDMNYLFRDSRRLEEISRGSHILNYDLLRLGKSVRKTNMAGSAEFGIFMNQEGGKERGNMLSHKKLDLRDENANQLNDLIELKEKLAGHSANVDHFSFVRFLFDEQRPETLGADGREICDKIIYVDRKRKREKNALPFFFVFDYLHELIYSKYEARIETYRFRRGDTTLLLHLYLGLLSKIDTAYTRAVNRYGYTKMILEEESGRMDGKREERKFYQLNKIIYADRFATDCYSAYFELRARRAKNGIADYPEYESSRAKWKELEKQNSYLVKDLTELLK